MTIARRALFAFIVFTLLASVACSPASNNNSATGNAGPAKPAATPGGASKSKPGTGSIDVQSLPGGAGITLVPTTEDTASLPQSYGTTPATINDLKPGKYTINLSLSGYKDFQQEVEVKEGSQARVKARLKK